jgi:hypothetical protein
MEMSRHFTHQYHTEGWMGPPRHYGHCGKENSAVPRIAHPVARSKRTVPLYRFLHKCNFDLLISWLQIQWSRVRFQIFWEIVGLERGPLSLVRITDDLLEWKSSGSGSRKSRLMTMGIRCADHATSGGRSVGIVCFRTKATEVFLCHYRIFEIFCILIRFIGHLCIMKVFSEYSLFTSKLSTYLSVYLSICLSVCLLILDSR